MAQIALTFDLCVGDIMSLITSADTREESKRNTKEIALNGDLWRYTAQVCEWVYVLVPFRWQWVLR